MIKVEISDCLRKIANNPEVALLKRAEARYKFWSKIYIAKEAIEKQLRDRYENRVRTL